MTCSSQSAPRCPHFWKLYSAQMQRQVKTVKIILRLAAVLCVSLALLAVLSLYAMHPVIDFGKDAPLTFTRRVIQGNKAHAGTIKDQIHLEPVPSIGAAVLRVSLSEGEMNIIGDRLKSRRAILEQRCQSLGVVSNSSLEAALGNIIIDAKHGVSWCPIYKAASSTWMNNFAVLGGAVTRTALELIEKNLVQVNTIVRQLYPRQPDIEKECKRLNQTKKFLIVRHPIERLVSAYRDKLEHLKGREYYYRRFGRHIAHKYRLERTADERTKLEPTFVEFLRYIVDERYFDEHWAPFFDSCSPCSIKYDYILKFETLEQEQNFLIQELDLQQYLYMTINGRNENPRGSTNSTVVNEYLQKVPKELLDKISKLYAKDFLLFSYENM